MLHHETQVNRTHRRWFIPVAATASTALLVGAIAWAGGGAASATSATTSSATRTTQVALPAYFVGAANRTGDRRLGLYREFVRTALPAGATPAQKAKAAVAVAMKIQPSANIERYVQPWSGTSVRGLTVTPKLITITLSGPGVKRSYTAAQTRLAVQGLVWTAQAAVGRGPIPVKFAVPNGSTKLFGTYPTTRTYDRPAMPWPTRTSRRSGSSRLREARSSRRVRRWWPKVSPAPLKRTRVGS